MEHTAAVATARYHSLSTMLRRSAQRHGENTAIIFNGEVWSYRAFDAVVDRLGRGLSALGIAKGDRVAIMARNSNAWLAVRFALARIGAVLIPVNFMLTVAEVRYILEHAGARMLFVDPTTRDVGADAASGLIDLVYGLPDERLGAPIDLPSWDTLLQDGVPLAEVARSDDLLQIAYTSGTESRPKGVMLTHDAVLWQYQACVIHCEWTPDTRALHALPLFHCAQLDAMIGPALQAGACNIVTATPSAQNLIPMLAEHRATSFFSPPTVWIELLRSPLFETHDLSALEKGYYGASIMPVEILREMRERLPALRLWNLYGQTEIAPVATILFPDEQESRAGSAGRPVLHVSTRIVDDDMCDVPTGGIGEIVHQSPQLMVGYLNDPERTAEAFHGGWFHSGDLARMDADGYLTIVDRKKDMIKTGGENVSSREVEEAIYEHPDVAEVAVIGLPDPRWIEAVTAVIVAKRGRGVDETELIGHCRARLATFKVPKRVVLVEALPRNASGKILKRDLRSLVGEGDDPCPGADPHV